MQVIEINLSSMVPYVSGPKRPQDRVAVSSMKEDFKHCLDEKVTEQYILCPKLRDITQTQGLAWLLLVMLYFHLFVEVIAEF